MSGLRGHEAEARLPDPMKCAIGHTVEIHEAIAEEGGIVAGVFGDREIPDAIRMNLPHRWRRFRLRSNGYCRGWVDMDAGNEGQRSRRGSNAG